MNDYEKGIAAWKRKMRGGWIGVDLDGTFAEYGGWKGPYSIGAPIPKMVERVKRWLAEGIEVKVLTARASRDANGDRDQVAITIIQNWTEAVVGQRLEVTNEKDYGMIELWDDRAVQIVPNTGERADGKADACCYSGLCDICKEAPDDAV